MNAADKGVTEDARRETPLSEAIKQESRKVLSPSDRRLKNADARFLAQLLKES